MKLYILSTTDSARRAQTEEFWNRFPAWDVTVHLNDGRFPSWGRNEILEEFYDSGDDWMAVIDDDVTVFEDRNLTPQFLDDPVSILNRLPEYTSSVWPLNGVVQAVNKIQAAPECQNNWIFQRAWNGGKLTMHSNRPGKRWFQRTDLNYAEDTEWFYQQIKDNCLTLNMHNVVIRERGTSTLFNDNQERRDAIDEAYEQIMIDYPEFTRNVRGQIIRTGLFNKYNTREKKLVLPVDQDADVFNNMFSIKE